MVRSLVADGKHNIFAITRQDSTSKMPEGVTVKRVDYESHESLISALKGMDILVVTLSGTTPPETSYKLIDAASAAGVPWIIPNEWGFDVSRGDGTAGREVFLGPPQLKIREYIKAKGNLSFIAVACGFWFEWSLAVPLAFGIDFDNKTATLYDQGTTKIHISTWPRVGSMVSKLLSLPLKSENGPCLEKYRNNSVYGASFFACQKDLLDSAMRVTKTKPEDWQITYEPTHERYAAGMKQFQAGDRRGFGKFLYARLFYPDGCGNLETEKPLDNEVFGLSNEDMDEATKRAINRAEKLKG